MVAAFGTSGSNGNAFSRATRVSVMRKASDNEGSLFRLFSSCYPVTPKGSDIPAQGNALGWVCVWNRALKGRDIKAS